MIKNISLAQQDKVVVNPSSVLRHIRLTVLLLCSIGNLLFNAGCGYSVHGKSGLPFSSITIDSIVNRTYEPGIDNRMREILSRELIKRGFVVNSSSDYKISGSLNSLELRTLSEKGGVAIEYEVIIKGDFKLKTPSGLRNLRSEGPFLVSFSSAERLQEVMVFREKAVDAALRNLSEQLIISIIYGP